MVRSRAALVVLAVIAASGCGDSTKAAAAKYAKQSCEAFSIDTGGTGPGLLSDPGKSLGDVQRGADLAASAAKRDTRWQSLADADVSIAARLTEYQAEITRLAQEFPNSVVPQTPQMSDSWNAELTSADSANEAACRTATAR